ncbi:carbonic anhydrase [Legionella maioricensis]|uniref:carbonic anhydrase n=1 Tax=Legionella maioricensis TaxID=2896528 RepID=A0A9X2CYC6_9GAMM|nr:carbonic anhydrase [Legionella maioricensis]MCL9683053.1 carbonic anhydrase [Legionella maioricensis]MCL9686401.1 carbonic anhydrase [Legionella maioricensis]
MSFRKCCILLITIVLLKTSYAQDKKEALTRSIERIEMHDQTYIKKKGPSFFRHISSGQTPLFTIVACSDSRVQSNILDDNPEGDFFTVRNIGNQIQTSMGSVDYGVSHLNTQILLIIGHSECGAIDAVMGDYKHLEPDIVKELDTIKISSGVSNIAGVQQNVNNQVNIALNKYSQKIKNEQLFVVGAVYDFANEMHKGAGELLIININGETNPAKLKKIINIKINE